MLRCHLPVGLLPLFVVPALAAGSQNIAPEGLFFHAFTGSVSGSEWSTWGALGATGRYNFSDLTASGSYNGTVSPTGSVIFDGGIGGGSFLDNDHLTLNFTFPGAVFHSTLSRAPYTDITFPVFLSTPTAGDASLQGAWNATILDFDPRTGTTLSSVTEAVQVAVNGTTVRLTRLDGTYFQAAWASVHQAGFRVIKPAASLPQYRTFPGSETSEPINLVGELRVAGPEHLVATLYKQSRTPFGSQVQTAQRFELTRVPEPTAVLGIAVVLASMVVPRRTGRA